MRILAGSSCRDGGQTRTRFNLTEGQIRDVFRDGINGGTGDGTRTGPRDRSSAG
ncbi:hypothetical protein ACFWZ2_06155 [Streptomyces sp. NPDC059002]|uniref:hypothetical protein n=1 Tax=Streptomyces sp. NPDC059002 TaxID=3346690 RepID=UPI0036BAD85B